MLATVKGCFSQPEQTKSEKEKEREGDKDTEWWSFLWDIYTCRINEWKERYIPFKSSYVLVFKVVLWNQSRIFLSPLLLLILLANQGSFKQMWTVTKSALINEVMVIQESRESSGGVSCISWPLWWGQRCGASLFVLGWDSPETNANISWGQSRGR